MRRAMQYEDLCQIGVGMYGKVFKARVVGTDVWVAIKRTTILESDEGIPHTAVREIAVLRKLQHQNIVRLLDATATRQDVSLVLEFVDMDLARYMKESHGRLDPRITRSLSQQLMLGIEFCHRNSIMHRDIKPQNLLVDSKLQLKITDFGLARMYSVPVPAYTREIVTLWYRAPELLLQGRHFGGVLYSPSVDIWSAGCVIAEMATPGCRPVFSGTSEIETIFMIFQRLGSPTIEEWPGLADMPCFSMRFPKWKKTGWADSQTGMGVAGIDLLDKCTMYDPVRRISARASLVHAYCMAEDEEAVA